MAGARNPRDRTLRLRRGDFVKHASRYPRYAFRSILLVGTVSLSDFTAAAVAGMGIFSPALVFGGARRGF